jgi:hypothetical protein
LVGSALALEAVDPFELGELDLLQEASRPTLVDRLGERIVARVAEAADWRLDPKVLQARCI